MRSIWERFFAESNEFFVDAESGHDNNPGTEYEPMLTIRKVLSLVKENNEHSNERYLKKN